MFKNYIKITLRNLLKHKLHSIINILGLSVGIACTIILFLFVQDELSYDSYNEKADRIFRVNEKLDLSSKLLNLGSVPAPLAETFTSRYPEVEAAVRFRNKGGNNVEVYQKKFKENDVIYVDDSFFDIFTIGLVSGDKNDLLKRPNTAAISKTLAKKYFGEKDPIGEDIIIDDVNNFEVTAVYEDIPHNSHFSFNILLSMETIDEAKEDSWLSSNFNTYILLKNSSMRTMLEGKFSGLVDEFIAPQLVAITGKSMKDSKTSVEFSLEPLEDIYLYSDIGSELGATGDIQSVYIFSIIAALILIIASINFINISTSRSVTRAKEVGIRKVLGSPRKQIIKQFLFESMFTSFVSIIIAVGIIELALPSFNSFTNKQLVMDYLNNPTVPIMLVSLMAFLGIIVGYYPSLVLSSVNPSKIVGGTSLLKSKKSFLRGGFVVFQFTASIILIVATLTVNSQLDYIQTKNLGYDKDHILILNDAYLLGNNVEAFKNEMLKNENITNAAVSGYLPVNSNRDQSGLRKKGNSDQIMSINQWKIDYDYIKTYGIEIIDGRDFSKDFGAETEKAIVNEEFVKAFGYENPIGQQIEKFINNEGDTRTLTIVGVMKNFHFESLKSRIEPLLFYLDDNSSAISFKVSGNNLSGVLQTLKSKWTEFLPNQPFNYSFLDERFNDAYRAEEKTRGVFGIFASLAIFIGCLGLFSLSAFTAEQKTKEIGIRKVLGSTVLNIVLMLSKEFIKLVAIAFVIAAPLAYYFMNGWLTDFEYRIDLGFTTFIIAGMISTSIAIATVSYHAIKAAIANPVKSIKYE